jgi:hypothetical protein
MSVSAAAAFLASRFRRDALLSLATLRARPHRCVNTSLSGTLFFSMCWCIRDEVHLDSRVHAANEAISLPQEGNMAKKAKKAKKAKSAVKKSAKKTRKASRKKKNMNM